MPIAGIGRIGGEIEIRIGLIRQVRRLDGRDQPRAITLVATDSVDVDVIGAGVGVDLELHRLASIDAELRREAFDIARWIGNVPHAFRRARQGVLGHDGRCRKPLIDENRL